jgi:hypothetical protein
LSLITRISQKIGFSNVLFNVGEVAKNWFQRNGLTDHDVLMAASKLTPVSSLGGSIKDDESIAAANENGIAMAFTGIRHFKH